MKNLPATKASTGVDLIRDSLDHVLAVAFPKSRSAGYAAALNLAQQADKYSEVDLDGSLFHYAVFGRTREQAGIALALTRHLQSIKASQFYAGGQLIVQPHRVNDVLSCYMDSHACNDHRAHCNQVISDPFQRSDGAGLNFELDDMKPAASYLLPCSYLTKFGAVTLYRNHPSAQEDQIQALAVKRGCEWCPNFNHNDFRKL